MDTLFHVIEGAQAVLHSSGVYRQVKLYRRLKGVYAKWGGGFIRLSPDNGTSIPYVSWRSIEGFDGIISPEKLWWKEEPQSGEVNSHGKIGYTQPEHKET